MRLVQGEVGGGNVSRDRLIAYIDGFNLYNGIHDEWTCAQLWLDVVQLVKDLRPKSDLVAVKYFTAYVRDDERARARQRDYIAALEAANPGVLNISLGRSQTKTRACRPASFHIGRSKITGAQLPEIVTASGGRTHSRPAKWGGRSRAGHKAT